MPQYDFKSVAGSGGDAVLRMLAERKAEERQMMLDEIFKRNSESVISNREADQSLQRDELAQRGRLAQQELENRTKQHEYGQAKDIVTMAGADEQITPNTAALLDRTGFGGRKEQRFVPGTPGIGVIAENELPPDAQVGSEQTMLRPGLPYEQARAAGEERKAMANANLAARVEADKQRAADKEEAFGREANLRRELQGNQIASAQGIAAAGREASQANKDAIADVKKTAADQQQQAKRDAALSMAESMNRSINDLMTVGPDGKPALKPGASEIVGGSRMWPGMPAILGGRGMGMPGALSEKVPGTQAADARAALQQIVGQQVVNLMSEMKKQSPSGATGFGALSEKELALLQAASARLSTAQSEEKFIESLKEIQDRVNLIYQNAPTSQATPTTSAQSPAVTGYTRRIE